MPLSDYHSGGTPLLDGKLLIRGLTRDEVGAVLDALPGWGEDTKLTVTAELGEGYSIVINPDGFSERLLHQVAAVLFAARGQRPQEPAEPPPAPPMFPLGPISPIATNPVGSDSYEVRP